MTKRAQEIRDKFIESFRYEHHPEGSFKNGLIDGAMKISWDAGYDHARKEIDRLSAKADKLLAALKEIAGPRDAIKEYYSEDEWSLVLIARQAIAEFKGDE